VYKLEDFVAGWFIGDFQPTLLKTQEVEVAVKRFKKGDTEPMHKQIVVTEISVLIYGSARIGTMDLNEGDVLVIPPGEYADFEALSDCALVCTKFPSIPSDKVLA
jgi:hypothetical protein